MKIEIGPEVTSLTGETDGVQAILNCAIKGARQLAEEVGSANTDLKREALSLAEMCESLVAEIEEEEERREKAAKVAKKSVSKSNGSVQDVMVFN